MNKTTLIIIFLFIILAVILILSKKSFSKTPPKLSIDDINNFEKVESYVNWFLDNDDAVKTINNRSINIIYREGYKPLIPAGANPQGTQGKTVNLRIWFIQKLYLDLNELKSKPKEYWLRFIDNLDEATKKTLITTGEIAIKYDFTFENFIYEEEISKIPSGKEREEFKSNYLSDAVIAAEIRILGWLYHEFFGEWYKIRENR